MTWSDSGPRLEEARGNLRELCASEDPRYIALEVVRYDSYGEAIAVSLDDAIARKQELLRNAQAPG